MDFGGQHSYYDAGAGVMLMEYVDYVDSEGGPFLIADATVMLDWHGSDGDGSNYERACQVFLTDPEPPGALISLGSGQALVWEPYGAGTGDLFFRSQSHLVFIRCWLDEPAGANEADELRTVSALAELPLGKATNLGSIEITSGILAILWAPESGGCIESLDIDESERPTGEMATGSSGLLVRIDNGNYTCLHDEVELGEASARRCHLVQ